jgi:hypothetical protein
VDDKRALNIVPKLWQYSNVLGRGAFQLHRRFFVKKAGAIRKANVGISNDNEGEKPSHRKTKVS